MALTTGVVRALVRGGAKYQQMLIDAFAEHVLGVKAHAQKIKPPTLDLSMLRTGFDVPEEKVNISDLLMSIAKKIPAIESRIPYKNLIFIIRKMRRSKVHEVIVEKS